MNIANLSTTNRTDRNVFIVQERVSMGVGTLQVFSNRQVLMQWIKGEQGICYIETNNAPIVLTKYNTLARMLLNKQILFITILPPGVTWPGGRGKIHRYEIIKAPLIRTY